MKEEALKLANDLEELHEQDLIDGVAHLSMPQASAMIRGLVEELDKQEYRRTHEGFSTIIDKVAPQIKPLSDEEIFAIARPTEIDGTDEEVLTFARAIEERHGPLAVTSNAKNPR